jgi:hypothetical protein
MNETANLPGTKKKRPFWHYIIGGCGGFVGLIIFIAILSAIFGSSDKPESTVAGGQAAESSQSEPVVEKTTTKETTSQKNAVRSAKQYLDVAGFSRKGLIKQLEFEGYSESDAAYGADNVKADWKVQAVRSAKNYLDISGFSRVGLIHQLEFDGYTNSEAKYAADQVGL